MDKSLLPLVTVRNQYQLPSLKRIGIRCPSIIVVLLCSLFPKLSSLNKQQLSKQLLLVIYYCENENEIERNEDLHDTVKKT